MHQHHGRQSQVAVHRGQPAARTKAIDLLYQRMGVALGLEVYNTIRMAGEVRYCALQSTYNIKDKDDVNALIN